MVPLRETGPYPFVSLMQKEAMLPSVQEVLNRLPPSTFDVRRMPLADLEKIFVRRSSIESRPVPSTNVEERLKAIEDTQFGILQGQRDMLKMHQQMQEMQKSMLEGLAAMENTCSAMAQGSKRHHEDSDDFDPREGEKSERPCTEPVSSSSPESLTAQYVSSSKKKASSPKEMEADDDLITEGQFGVESLLEELGHKFDDVLLMEIGKDQILLLTYEVDEVENIDEAETDSEKEVEDPFGLTISFLEENEDDDEDVQFPGPTTSPTLPTTSLIPTPTTIIPTPPTVSPISTTSSIPTVSPSTTPIPHTTQILPPPITLPSSTAPTSANLRAWDPEYVPSTSPNWTTSTSTAAVTI